MGVITLPWSMVQDQQNQVKANSVHVDDNFNTLLNATNGKLEADGSIVPTADLPMGNHKITGVATPTNSGDVATKGYVDSADTTLSATCVKLTGAQTVGGVKTFTSSPVVPAPTNNTDASTKKYVDDGLAGCVKTTGNQTIAGTKTFSSTISGNINGSSASCTGNAATVTNGVYTTGNQTIGGTKTFSSSPLVPNVGTMNDNSQKAASTKFVLDILKTIYPVGSVYIGTQSSCPMSSLFGTWSLVSSGRALWTGNGSNGNSTIAAGLPDITGKFGFIGPDVTSTTYFNHASGAFTGTYGTQGMNGIDSGGVYAGGWGPNNIEFKASKSSSVYGNSTTVQPPAYVVNVWRRTA